MKFSAVVITDEECERAEKKLVEIIEKLRQIKSSYLYILVKGRGVLTTIPRVREALLSNLSVGIRLYVFSSYDELEKVLDACLRELEKINQAYVITDDAKLKDSALRVLNKLGIHEVSIC